MWVDGRSVETVEGLVKNVQNEKLSAVQQAFVDRDAPQCGFCTSGQLMAAKALLSSNAHPTAEDARAAMTGNTEQVGCLLYTSYLIPFEIASMLLLVAMIGAIVLAKREL